MSNLNERIDEWRCKLRGPNSISEAGDLLEDCQSRIASLESALKLAQQALQTYADKTQLHSIRQGYGVFYSPGPEFAQQKLAEIEKHLTEKHLEEK